MSQTWDPQLYKRNARFVSELGAPVVALLNPKPGEHILDLGCGDGVITRALHDIGCRVVGIDASPDMVAAARERGVDVRHGKGEALRFDSQFDAVFSNAALHWMPQSEAVVSGVYKALRSGGRFVGEFGGAGNIATIMNGLDRALRSRGQNIEDINPWYFPSDEAYRTLLEEHGFVVHKCALISRPTPLETDLMEWLRVFSGAFLDVLPSDDHEAFLHEVAGYCQDVLRDEAGQWHVDYVRLRFHAVKQV